MLTPNVSLTQPPQGGPSDSSIVSGSTQTEATGSTGESSQSVGQVDGTWQKIGWNYVYIVGGVTLGMIEPIGHWKYPSYRATVNATWINKDLGYTRLVPAKAWVEAKVSTALAETSAPSSETKPVEQEGS